MEASIELCDQVWVGNLCLQPELLLYESPRVSRSHLDGILAVSRFLSKGIEFGDPRPKSIVLEFFRAIPSSFRRSFWPQSFTNDSISSFFTDFLRYISESCEICPDFEAEIALFVGEVVLAVINNNGTDDSGICRVFLSVLSKNFPPLLPSDANILVPFLLHQLAASPQEQLLISSERPSSFSAKHTLSNYEILSSAASRGQWRCQLLEEASLVGRMMGKVLCNRWLRLRKILWRSKRLHLN